MVCSYSVGRFFANNRRDEAPTISLEVLPVVCWGALADKLEDAMLHSSRVLV
jgi:hypothetical protein